MTYDPKWYEPYVSCWRNEEPSRFAFTLAQTLPIEPNVTRLLDIGCGSGIQGIYSLIEKQARSVTFMDIERVWLNAARCNVDIKVRELRIRPAQARFLDPSDLSDIPYEEVARHDLIVFNPPQLPYAFLDEESRRKIDSDPVERRFRNGGAMGLEVVEKFLGWYSGLPSPKPDAVILLSSFLGKSNIEALIASFGGSLRREPTPTEAPLRRFLWEAAEGFSHSEVAAADRRIRKIGDVWYKHLLTYQLAWN